MAKSGLFWKNDLVLAAAIIIPGLAILAYIIGIPPHFMRADDYAENRINEYISKCHSALLVISEDRPISKHEMDSYLEEKKKLGMSDKAFIVSKLDYYVDEYYETKYKGLPEPEIQCSKNVN